MHRPEPTPVAKMTPRLMALALQQQPLTKPGARKKATRSLSGMLATRTVFLGIASQISELAP